MPWLYNPFSKKLDYYPAGGGRNQYMCWAYMATHAPTPGIYPPHPETVRLPFDVTDFNPGAHFKTATWLTGTADAGSNATTIIDANPTGGTATTFLDVMKFAMVTWDAGASIGFVQAVNSATNITILKMTGTDMAAGDIYTIKEAHYTVPVTGYYRLDHSITWQGADVSPDCFYASRLLELRAGRSPVDRAVNVTSVDSSTTAQSLAANNSILTQLTANDLLIVGTYHQKLIGTAINSRPLGTTAYSYIRVELVQVGI